MDPARLVAAGGHVLRSSKSSNLTDQLQKEREAAKAERNPDAGDRSMLDELGLRTPTKIRSVSDVLPPTLSPSPVIVEASRSSRDDSTIITDPITPSRPFMSARGLSLQLPAREAGNLHNASFASRAPLSPKLDSINTYGSAATVLPRRSRGLDFSRACTNLHHSTLADQSSPDSSPIMPGRGMMIPSRKGYTNLSQGVGSPGSISNSLWSTMANMDRSNVASSMGSVAMMDSDSSDSSSTDDDLIETDTTEDPILNTPQVHKLSSNIPTVNPHFQNSNIDASPGRDWMGGFSPAAASLISFQRARLRKGRSRKSSSSASMSGGSSLASPTPVSPSVLKSIESTGGPSGYFARELAKSRDPRRSSLSLETRDLHISSGGESDDEKRNDDQLMVDGNSNSNAEGQDRQVTDDKRTVVRRPVTRRGNLLPKTKNFARIRAALMEEGAPVDTEVRREAEVVRQVRESDPDQETTNQGSDPATGNSSPSMQPTVSGLADAFESIPSNSISNDQSGNKRHSDSFSQQAISKMNTGRNFWESFGRLQTPPPVQFNRRGSPAISEDLTMDSPIASTPSSIAPAGYLPPPQLVTEGQDLVVMRTNNLPIPVEVIQKVNNKRRRDDDFDVASFKRRAVSPGVSVQNSPILQQSPAQKDGSWWTTSKSSGDPPGTSAGQAPGDRVSSGGNGNSLNGAAPKRIGFQGMVDTSDGLMNMSIE